jgi:GntR family transcriptional regulator
MNQPVLRPQFNPLYQQVREALLVRMGQGEWQAGSLLPSEVELAQQFEVSQGTVRKAIDSLAADNLVVRRQGRGTYVATHSEARVQFRFLRIRPNKGEAQQPESRFLQVTKLRAPAEIAELLAIKTSEQVLVIKRVLSFAGEPQILDVIWLAAARFKGLTAERLSKYSGPLYGLFEQEFQTRMIRCEESLTAQTAQQEHAGVLGVEIGSPLLVVERVSFSYDDEPVEVRIGYCNTKNFHYFNQLS